MNRRAIAWGAAFLLAGFAVLARWLPGAAGWATGPRLGLGTFLLVTGLVLLAGSFAGAIRARTEASGKGGCPVGATCACGHFNFKPRATCRECGTATVYSG